MALIEAIKTNLSSTSVENKGIPYRQDDKNSYLKENFFEVKEYSASSSNETTVKKESSVNTFINKNPEKQIELLKRKVLSMLKNEDIVVGYTSMTELFLQDLLEQNPSLAKEVINRLYVENLENPGRLQKIIEVMSNLDYEGMYPTNTILALGVINNIDVAVQEAAIAAYEKWEDPKNISVLRSTNYTVDWIEDYAKEVIDYLEGC